MTDNPRRPVIATANDVLYAPPSLHHAGAPTTEELRDALAAAEAEDARQAAEDRARAEQAQKQGEAAARNDAVYLPQLDAINATVRALFPGWETLAAEVERLEGAYVAAADAIGPMQRGAALARLYAHPLARAKGLLNLLRTDITSS